MCWSLRGIHISFGDKEYIILDRTKFNVRDEFNGDFNATKLYKLKVILIVYFVDLFVLNTKGS